MTNREPRPLPIDMLEAIDHDAPVLNELIRTQRVLDLANRALALAGVEPPVKLVLDKRAVVGTPELRDKLSMEEAAELVVRARVDEIRLAEEFLTARLAEGVPVRLSHMLKYLRGRLEQVVDVAARRPEDQGEFDENDCCTLCGAHFSEPHAPDCKRAD